MVAADQASAAPGAAQDARQQVAAGGVVGAALGAGEQGAELIQGIGGVMMAGWPGLTVVSQSGLHHGVRLKHGLVDALASFSGSPVQFGSWDDAFTFLFSLASKRPTPVVIDEFPLLTQANQALPSIVQRHLDAGQSPAAPASYVRLLLCGSALSVMGKLLAGSAPLRGRARDWIWS